jgi:hypothetical protein
VPSLFDAAGVEDLPHATERLPPEILILRSFTVFFATVAAALAVQRIPPASAQSLRLADFVRNDAGFTAPQWSALDRGDVVVRELPTADRTDVAVIAIARLARPAAAVVHDARTKGSATAHRAAHAFGTPASLADVSGLHFTPAEIRLLPDCRPSSCNMKLSAADMSALSAIVRSGLPDAPDRATDYLRRRVVEMTTAYRQRGDGGAPVYDDNGTVQSGRSFEATMARSCRICRAIAGDTAGARMFWVMDSMPRARPTLRVMDEFTVTSEPGVTAFVAKQIYANHYFEAGLEMLIVVDDAVARVTSASRGTLLISVRLYHFDQIPKLFIFDLRARVVDRLEDAVVADLRLWQR